MDKKKKVRSLLLQSLEERILWDATLQPTPPEESVEQTQEAAVSAVEENPVEVTEEPSLNPNEQTTLDTFESNENSSTEASSTSEDSVISANNSDTQNLDITESGATQELVDLNEQGDTVQIGQSNEEADALVEVVVIDSSVENREALIEDIRQQNEDNDRSITIIEINGEESGVDQVSDILRQFDQPVDSLHIVGHGDQDQIFLGADRLSQNTLEEHSESLQNWSQYLSENADLLFYGCDVVENEQGEILLAQIAEITGADVSGSDDTTGTENLGGDWDLEFNLGTIETQTLLQHSSESNWSGILALSAPTGGIDATPTVMIDEGPEISLLFDSPAGSDTGFGPFGDFVAGDELDINGIDYLGAPVSFTEVGTWDGTQWVDSNNDPITTHPFDNIAAGPLVVPTGVEPGDTWFAIELPFGSFTEAQPPVELNVDASFNSNAVVGDPINLEWTPGYLLGSTADGSANDPVQGTTSAATITPEVIQIEKRDDLPEQETPSGPNYPVEYTITVNVAQGETIDNVVVTDFLPSNAVFLGDGTNITTATVSGINGASSTSSNVTLSGNVLTVDLGTVTGANGVTGPEAASGEIEITYYVYFEDIVTSGGVPNINSVPSLNESTVTGIHNGVAVTDSGDADDGGADGAIDDGDVEVEVQNLTTQKTPQVVTGFNPDGTPILAPLEGNAIIPGALIFWTVDIQVSDFHAFDNLAFTDQLSDGQDFVDGSSPFTLSDGTMVPAGNLTPTLFVGNDSDFGGNTDDSTPTAIDFDPAFVFTAGETPPIDVNDV